MTSMVKNIIQRKKSDFLPTTMLASNEWKWIHNIWQKTASTSIPSPAHLHRLYFLSFNYLKWSLLVLTNDLSLQNYLETSRPGGDMSFIDKIPNWFSLLIKEKIHGS